MPSFCDDKFNKMGRLLFNKNNHADACDFFLQSIQEYPLNASSLVFLGTICWQQQKMKEAVAYLERGMELGPEDPEIIKMVAAFLSSTGKTEETERLCLMYASSTGQGDSNAQITRRLLAVYDLSVQPFSVGDLINFQAGSMMKCTGYDLNAIDFCFISDPNRPPLDPVFSRMMCDNNRLHNLFTILPLLQLNPRIGSIHVFDSYQGLQDHLTEHQAQYECWPTSEQLDTNSYSYYEIIELLEQCHRDKQSLPRLSLPEALINWNAGFLRNHVAPLIPVTVNLRNNPHFHTYRNSDILAWTSFFNYCQDRYPVKFIVLCSRCEVFQELRSCPNVVVAKDHGTSLEQDMALIMSSAFHIGAASGPTMIPILSDKPYSIVNCGSILDILPSLVRKSEQVATFSFAGELQRIILVPETLDILMHEFEAIWHSRDWSNWSTASTADGADGLNWLK